MRVVFFLIVFLFLGCSQGKKEITIDKDILNAQNVLSNTENILKKIPSSKKYSNIKPVFSTNGKKIYLSYGNFEKDLNYRVDNLKSVDFLNDNEFEILKNNIDKLSKIGIKEQDYVIYNPDLEKGIYIYSYKNEDWKLEQPEMETYISLIENIDESDQWFGNTFKVIIRKKPLMLLTKIRG